MEKIFRIKDTLSDRITCVHLAAFVVALPFDSFYSECILASLLVHTSIHLSTKKFVAIRFAQLLPVTLYVLTITYTWYPAGLQQALLDWQKQLALFLFPMLFALSAVDWKKVLAPVMLVLAYTCTIVVVYLFADAWRVIRYLHLPMMSIFSNGFTHHNFAAPLGIHATYLSMFVALSIAVCLSQFTRRASSVLRAVYILCCVILFAGLVQLASRAVMVTFFIIINIVLPFCYLPNNQWRNFIITSLSISMVCIFVLAVFAPTRERLFKGFGEDIGLVQVRAVNVVEPRVARWGAALKLVKAAPLTGYGSGSEGILLNAAYFRGHLYQSFLHSLNAHNQYLSLLIKHGIPGLLIYVYVLLTGFVNAIRKKDFLFCSFLLLVAVVSLTENILDVNKGIFFFSFFYSLFCNALPNFDAAALFPGLIKKLQRRKLIPFPPGTPKLPS